MTGRLAKSLAGAFLLVGVFATFCPAASVARDAAFADPGFVTTKAGSGGDAVVVEPKAEMDTGESVVNESRRTTIFFVNKTPSPVEVVGVATNDDLNVKSYVVSNDCSLEGKILPSSRCSVVVETMPTNTGSWTAEVLLTHKGQGRIARAKLMGKASSQSVSDRKDSGFTLSTKDVKPIDFGEVVAAEAKVVRSALMINDSPENIVLVSIDVIAAENGLERLEQGCLVDMELRPGESCPVTLLWRPVNKGLISTDLIIRHTGKLGFAVIPIRGVAREPAVKEASAAKMATSDNPQVKPPSLDIESVEKALAGGIPELTEEHLPKNVFGQPRSRGAQSSSLGGGTLRLIGTVGNRAVLVKPDGSTTIVAIGEEVDYGDGRTAKVTLVAPKSVEIFEDGKKSTIMIGSAHEITSRARGSGGGNAPPSLRRGGSSSALGGVDR